MGIKNNLLLLLLLVFFASCGNKKFNSAEDLSEFIQDQDNFYCYKKTVQGVDYVLQYRPTDLLVHQELGKNHDQKLVEKLRNKYRKYIYFNLSMSINNKELLSSVVDNKLLFGEMVNDLAFNINKKVHLCNSNKDTLEMSDFIYPRLYGMTNSTTILIIYPRDSKFFKDDYFNLIISDLGFFTGEVKFKMKANLLYNEPTITL